MILPELLLESLAVEDCEKKEDEKEGAKEDRKATGLKPGDHSLFSSTLSTPSSTLPRFKHPPTPNVTSDPPARQSVL